MNTKIVPTKKDWQIAELVIDVTKMEIIWMIGVKLCQSEQDFHTHYGTQFDETIFNMIEAEEIVKQGNILQLNEISTAALIDLHGGTIPPPYNS